MVAPLRIGLLLYPGCMPAGLFAFADLLHAANRRGGRRLYETTFVSAQPWTATGPHGTPVRAQDRLPFAGDALLVPGFWAESQADVEAALSANADLVATLRRLGRRCQLWSYCAGVSLLAAAGQLDGRRATATWWLADALRRRHPRVHWAFGQDCVASDRTITAGGTNGHLPIAQALIERDLDAEAFLDLTRLMVLPRPTPGHDAFEQLALIEQGSDCLRDLHRVVERLPAARLTASALATALGMSSRTLARRVRSETGLALAAHVRRLKLRQVSDRLVLTSEPASAISAALGFSSESNMRRAFKAVTGMTPGNYRRRHGRR